MERIARLEGDELDWKILRARKRRMSASERRKHGLSHGGLGRGLTIDFSGSVDASLLNSVPVPGESPPPVIYMPMHQVVAAEPVVQATTAGYLPAGYRSSPDDSISWSFSSGQDQSLSFDDEEWGNLPELDFGGGPPNVPLSDSPPEEAETRSPPPKAMTNSVTAMLSPPPQFADEPSPTGSGAEYADASSPSSFSQSLEATRPLTPPPSFADEPQPNVTLTESLDPDFNLMSSVMELLHQCPLDPISSIVDRVMANSVNEDRTVVHRMVFAAAAAERSLADSLQHLICLTMISDPTGRATFALVSAILGTLRSRPI